MKDKKTYVDEIKKEDLVLYSINFQHAEFEEIKTMSEDTILMQNKVKSTVYETNDFAVRRYFKQISSIIDYKINQTDNAK
jgi:hypothetical protein